MPLSSCAKAAFQAGTLVYHFLSTETWTCDRQLFSATAELVSCGQTCENACLMHMHAQKGQVPGTDSTDEAYLPASEPT